VRHFTWSALRQERTSERSPQVDSRTRGRPCDVNGSMPRFEGLAPFSWAAEIWSGVWVSGPAFFGRCSPLRRSPVARRLIMCHIENDPLIGSDLKIAPM
jgi:hypothetical protein